MGYIEQLEIELSSVQNGFKEEEKRALYDISTCDLADAEKLAFAAYGSEVYQVRMYAVFLFGHMSDSKDILSFMRDKVSADPNWRVHYVMKELQRRSSEPITKLKKRLLVAIPKLRTLLLITI